LQEMRQLSSLQAIRQQDGRFSPPRSRPRENEMQLDLEEEPVGILPPNEQQLTAMEAKSNDLLVVLEKISGATGLLEEAQSILMTHNFQEPAEYLSMVVSSHLRNVEAHLQKIIVELVEQPENQEPSRPVVHEAPNVQNDNDMEADAALAFALQTEEQEKNDLRLAHALQEREEIELQEASRRAEGSRRAMERQNERRQREMQNFQRLHMGVPHMNNIENIVNFNLQRMQQMIPHVNFQDSDSEDGFPEIFRNLQAGGLHNGDMDDIMHMLEMQDRGADLEEIDQFSNEEKFHARSNANAENDNSSDHNCNEQCCICMEPFVEGDKIRRLPCLHIFHTNEIDQWLRVNRTCPICKTDIQQAG